MKGKTTPRLARRFLPLTLEAEQYGRLERMATARGKQVGEYLVSLLGPLLAAENAEALYWYLVALDGEDQALIAQHCGARKWDIGELLDVLVGDAIEGLDE